MFFQNCFGEELMFIFPPDSEIFSADESYRWWTEVQHYGKAESNWREWQRRLRPNLWRCISTENGQMCLSYIKIIIWPPLRIVQDCALGWEGHQEYCPGTWRLKGCLIKRVSSLIISEILLLDSYMWNIKALSLDSDISSFLPPYTV